MLAPSHLTFAIPDSSMLSVIGDDNRLGEGDRVCVLLGRGGLGPPLAIAIALSSFFDWNFSASFTTVIIMTLR